MSQTSARFVLFATLAACGPGTETAPTPTPAVRAEPADDEPEALTPPVVAITSSVPNIPGPAYFAVDTRGVVRLDDHGFAVIAGSPKTPRAMQVGPDGLLYAVGDDDIVRLEGEAMVSMAKADPAGLGGPIQHLAIGFGGDLWVSTRKGISHWDGKAWITDDRTTVGVGDETIAAIAIDKAGKVWVAAGSKLLVRDGETWKPGELGKAARGKPRIADLRTAADGQLHAVLGDTLIHLAAEPRKVELGSKGKVELSAVRFAAGGSIGLISGVDVFHVPAGGSPRQYSSLKSRDFAAEHITAIAPDDSGRLWVGSDLGAIVIVPGAARVEWLAGSVPALAGPIGEIVVFGSGPASLPTGGPRIKGGLTGKLLRGGAPVAGTTVELCVGPALALFKKTPCNDAGLKFSAKTNSDGVWKIDDVPLASYGLAVKDGKKWHVTPMPGLGDGMTSGAVFDTGSVELAAK